MLIIITSYYSKKRNKKVEQQKRKSLIIPFSWMFRRIVLLLVRRNFKILLETRYLCDKGTRDAIKIRSRRRYGGKFWDANFWPTISQTSAALSTLTDPQALLRY